GVDLDAPAAYIPVENVVSNHDIVRTGNVNRMVVRLVIGAVRTAVLTRSVPSDVVDNVLLDGDVRAAEIDAIPADSGRGAISPHVVDVIADDIQMLSPA